MTYLCLLVLAAMAAAVSGLTSVRYTVPEEAATNTLLGNILRDARNADPDWLGNGNYQCTAIPGQPLGNLFTIRDCSVYVARVIDREAVCPYLVTCELQLDVSISRFNDTTYFDIVTLEVSILDINDNGPVFEYGEVDLNIPEYATIGSVLTVPSARDLDAADSRLSYYLHSHTVPPNELPFRLDVTSPMDNSSSIVQLVLVRTLDRETLSMYQLFLSASDNRLPRRSAVLKITVHVTDINDNSPVLNVDFLSNQTGINVTSGQEYVCISEHIQPGTVIAFVKASDSDNGDNGNITFTLDVQPPGLLAVEKSVASVDQPDVQEARVIVIGNLTSQSSLNVVVTAEDGGTPSLRTQYAFTVYVTENDRYIVFENFTSPAQVFENMPNGSIISTFYITTNRMSENDSTLIQIIPNSEFRLHVTQVSPGEFEVSLLTNDILDREQTSLYIIEIIAFDPDMPAIRAVKTLQVIVIDVNDNVPVFEQNSYYVTISRQSQIGSSVITVHAIDQDATTRIYYGLRHVTGGPFFINGWTGTVVLAAPVTSPHYHMVISACDGLHCTECPLNVYVEGVGTEIVG